MTRARWIGAVVAVLVVVAGVLLARALTSGGGLGRGDLHDLADDASRDLGTVPFTDHMPGTLDRELDRSLVVAAAMRGLDVPKVSSTPEYSVHDNASGDGPSGLMTYGYTLTDRHGGHPVCLTFRERSEMRGTGAGLYEITRTDGHCPKGTDIQNWGNDANTSSGPPAPGATAHTPG